MWSGSWMHGGAGSWGPSMWGMGLFWIALLVVVAVLVFRLVGERPTSREPPVREDTPLEILKRRYARGEIDRAEFEERRRDLS